VYFGFLVCVEAGALVTTDPGNAPPESRVTVPGPPGCSLNRARRNAVFTARQPLWLSCSYRPHKHIVNRSLS